MSTTTATAISGYNIAQKIALRTFIIYAIITFIPFAPSFYQQDFDAGFSVNNYPFRWLDVISQNNPWFFSSLGGKNYWGWFITLLVSAGAGIVWYFIEHQMRKEQTVLEKDTLNGKLYNWFYILVRYQIVLRMSWFAIAKVFPVQMPFPTISQLNTNLGDFTPGKLYWLTTGVSPFFEVFAGVFELIATVLLLSRRTTTLGALMMIAILLPIWFVNIGYDAGVELASLHLLVLSLTLLVRNARKFWDILIAHKTAALDYVQAPAFTAQWQRALRIGFKVAFIFLFLIFRGYEYGRLYANGKTFKLPLDNGLQNFTGLYNVSEFKLNNKLVPYAPDDTTRWQNVVFEKFNTISIKVAKPFALNTANKIRTTEYYGNIGRLYYGYDADTARHTFKLYNRADSKATISLKYTQPDSLHLVVSGVNENNDSVYAVLTRLHKVYPLQAKRKPASAD